MLKCLFLAFLALSLPFSFGEVDITLGLSVAGGVVVYGFIVGEVEL